MRRVKDSLYPWDLGYEKNEEWVNLLSVFDSIESELDEWNSKQKKKEELEDSNAIPPKKGSIDEKIDRLGSKKQQQQRDSKKIQFEVPWKNSKKAIKDFKKYLGF